MKTLNITEKTGNLVALKSVTEDDDIMIINKSGITIRLAIYGRIMGRVTQGVKLINIKENDSIAAVCVVDRSDDKSDAPDAADASDAASASDVVSAPDAADASDVADAPDAAGSAKE